MFTDVALVVLPSLIIWKLQMERRLRIVLVGLIGLGLLYASFQSCICVPASARICSAARFQTTKLEPWADSHDRAVVLGVLKAVAMMSADANTDKTL